MKTATLTYQRHDNIGAMLQCYALQQTIVKLGCENEIVDYVCAPADRIFGLSSLRVKGLKKYITSCIGVISRLPKKPAFNKFRRCRLNLTKRYDRSNINEIDGRYDGYIVGSDNVWNSRLTGLDANYFLDFVSDGHRKASYAASMGLAEPHENERASFAAALKDFAYVSTRERRAAQSLEKICSRKVDDACDPTFFLNAEQWTELALPPSEKYEYVLAYHMSPSLSFTEFVRKFAARKGLPVIYVPFPYGMCGCRAKPHIGPCEWLGYIKNAGYVVTDSFHGCVFSSIFERNLIIKVSQLGERIVNLTEKLGIGDRMVNTVEEAVMLPEQDYSRVRGKIEKYRADGLEKLSGIIKTFSEI